MKSNYDSSRGSRAVKERNVEAFNSDITSNDGYLYSTTNKLSSVIANQRITEAIIAIAELEGKKIIDIGCGDGTYSIKLLQAGACQVVGVDAAENAIICAKNKAKGLDRISFNIADIYSLKVPEVKYDIAVVRGILHHLYEADRAVEVISSVAREVVVLEPNGYNPVLKILEKVSPYHVKHEEKSYSPALLRRWFDNFGGKMVKAKYIGLVPMFCPDFLAAFLKLLEPIVESVPGVRNIACGQYLMKIRIG